jgi:hypothetical protein
MPKGLQINDAGEFLVDGKLAAETPEGRAWLEDQQKRRDWVPAMALAMFTLGRIPGGAPSGAIGAFTGRRPPRGTDREVLLRTYRDPPKKLKELQDAVAIERDGTDVHHIVERRAAARERFSEAWTYHPANEVRIPRMKHWEITGWYQTKSKAYKGQSPREYLRGKTWQERYEFGLQLLIDRGVLKR